MILLQISVLLFSVALYVHPSNTKKIQKWQHNTKKVNSLSDDQENCFCYPDGQLPTVNDLLDSKNKGQERVVIYLYKNVLTNEIKMYTPSSDKQMLIPDIPYESGDGLDTVTTENVYTLFYNNPYRIKVYNDRFENLNPALVDSLPIGLNVGAIEHIFPNGDNYLTPNNTYSGNEYNLADNLIIAYGPDGSIVTEPQKELKNIPNNIFPGQYGNNILETPEQGWMSNNMNYTYTKHTKLQAFPDNPQAISLNPQSFPYKLQAFPDTAQDIPGNSEGIPSNLQTFPSNQQPSSANPQAISENPQAISTNPQVFPSDQQAITPSLQAFPDNSNASPDNLQPHSYIGGIDQHVVYTFQKNEESNHFSSGSRDINNPLSTQYVPLSFNIWFTQQMKRFQNIHLPNDIKTIDSNVLKILVQKTFFENNIYVSANGMITDAKGSVIDAENLELRPLLIGEKFNYQILQNIHKPIILPKHFPYLEGILVTFVSPPQVLGIIPLGKTYLPETYKVQSLRAGLTTVNGSKIYINSYGNSNAASYSTSSKGPYTLTVKETYSEPIKTSTGPIAYHTFSGNNGEPSSGNLHAKAYSKILPVAYPYSLANKEPKSGASEVNYWSSGPYYTVSKLPYPTDNWNPSVNTQPLGQGRRLSDVKIKHHYDPPIKTWKKSKGLSKKPSEIKEVIEVTTAEPFLNLNSSKSGRRFPAQSLKGVINTLLYLLNDLPSRRGLNSTEDNNILNESENVNDGGAPDFRIIGGSAATGSGTPLSNKGRSGYIDV